MRDNNYLKFLLYDIWENYFCDVPRKNIVLIKFGKYSKRQLGCIKMIKDGNEIKRLVKRFHIDDIPDEENISMINLTRYFQNEDIPEDILISTIAHEICHYTHGFNSPLERRFPHPHRGNVVLKELDKRGLGNMYKNSKKWLKENWRNFIS